MQHPEQLQPSDKSEPYDPNAYNPFDEVEFLPGLGTAVLWVVLSYVFVNLLLLPVHVV
jgi:hypothetical protein